VEVIRMTRRKRGSIAGLKKVEYLDNPLVQEGRDFVFVGKYSNTLRFRSVDRKITLEMKLPASDSRAASIKRGQRVGFYFASLDASGKRKVR
jgi:hypothetical protein